MEHNSTFPIKLTELDMLRDEAASYLKSVQWEQGAKAKSRDKNAKDESILLYLSRANNGTNSADITSVSKTILALKKRLLPDSVAIPIYLNQTLYAVQEGLTLGIWIKDSYYDASGLSSLNENKSALDNNGKREYESKMHTATAFMLFASSYKILNDLKPFASDDLSVMKQKFAGIPEVSLMSPIKGISCLLFYYDKYLGHPEIVKSDKDVIDFTVVYFEALIDEIQLRKSNLEYTETIEDRTYKLEKSEFAVSGWNNVFQGTAKSIEFNKIKFEQIVGNRDAKHFARRLTERMLSYDFTAKKNPFQELGGFMPVFMGYGIPGTGKSMLIAAIATRLKEHCDTLDIPFLFHPMPDTLISTFQGGSAEKMVEWMKPLQDPTKLIFAPIDDAENNLQERTAQGVSAGVKEVIGVFLRYTEGAYAVNYGNSSIGLFTNLPEMLDKAVISRVQGRFKIDGARTEHDFLDQDHLWWRKLDETMPNFVNMQGPENYAYLQDQGLAKNMGEILNVSDKPTEERVHAVYDKVEKQFQTNQHLFYANLYKDMQKAFPFFSSRDVRNIQSAVSLRLTDFDLDEEWFENPEIYFKQDYDTKYNMLQELMRANMKGLDFSEIRRQEVVRYLDNVATIADTDFKRKVDARVNQLNIETEARKHLKTINLEDKLRNITYTELSSEWATLNRIDYDYKFNDGSWKRLSRESYDRGNGTSILLYNKVKQTVILTKQFRMPAYDNNKNDGMSIEVCAGAIDKNEAPEICIIREVEEEVGYKIEKAVKVMEAYTSPGAVTEKCFLFVAEYTDAMKINDGGGLDIEDEEIEVLEIPFSEALKMVDNFKIIDAKTIMLLQYAQIHKLLN